LGGLLATPEVADIVATLRLIAEPGVGSAAMRVLTGARWRIGVADIAALARRARDLSISRPNSGDANEISDTATLAAALREVAPEPSEQAGLADAIADPGPREQYSESGFTRIVALSRELATLRERSGQPLAELVADVERTIGVGVETQARRAMAGAGAGREHLDAFAEVVAGYASDSGASLSGLLAFLAAAESVENGLEPGEVEVARDRVQVLTVHAAKGLEWEIVAVPHISRGVFPSGAASGTWLGALAELPTTLRGDRQQDDAAEGVPVLDLSDLYDRADLERAIKAHKEALDRRRLDEDRRLFYVALTRTERVLLVSAHHWAETGSTPKGPSDFLLELKHASESADSPAHGAVDIDRWDDPPEVDAVNPFTDTIEQGAALVRAALKELSAQPETVTAEARENSSAAGGDIEVIVGGPSDMNAPPDGAGNEGMDPSDDPDGWAADVDALLAEYEAAQAIAQVVELPGQIAATALVELRADPAKLAARLRRPLPFPPNPLARRGTAFHAWVQRWFGADRLLGLDELPGAADNGVDAGADAELTKMQDAFLNSPWAHRSPLEVEIPFETSIAGTVIRGRMDAVFAEPGGGWIVVDWKTGAEPSAADEPVVAMQLAVYRLAWARLMAAREGGTEQEMLERIGAAFHYVRSGRTIAPTELPGPDELAELIRNAAPVGSPSAIG
jgi:DNA helicase-2/ATP-dependent DNA helicase PcrA